MYTGTGKMNRMTPEEIRELCALKGWTMAKLAELLDVTPWSVRSWAISRRKPLGPASVLMRLWLAEARRETPAPPPEAQPVEAVEASS